MSASDWKDGFLFVGNHLALDFLNTRPVINGRPTELLPDFSAFLRWLKAAGLQRKWDDPTRAAGVMEAVHALRERLRQDILNYEHGGAVRPSTIAELNRLMAEHPMCTRLRRVPAGLVTESYCDPRAPEDLLAPLAHAAAMLLAHADRSRIRKCENCALHFLDTSKKGSRRWCSMQLCGNRVKVAAYAARHRARD